MRYVWFGFLLALVCQGTLAVAQPVHVQHATPHPLAVERAKFSAALATATQVTATVQHPHVDLNWPIQRLYFPILAQKIKMLANTPEQTDVRIESPDTQYGGITLHIHQADGSSIQLIVFKGTLQNGQQTLGYDHERLLEYWLWGNVELVQQQLLGLQMMPIYTFEQCKMLGHALYATSPRQCVLPDDRILLETNEPVTQETVNVTTFDECLEKGLGIINTVPRRCLLPGGRILTEPVRAPQLDFNF